MASFALSFSLSGNSKTSQDLVSIVLWSITVLWALVSWRTAFPKIPDSKNSVGSSKYGFLHSLASVWYSSILDKKGLTWGAIDFITTLGPETDVRYSIWLEKRNP